MKRLSICLALLAAISIQRSVAADETARATIADLHLLEPAWSSVIVHRESSALLQLKPGGPITARLAFPAAEVMEISTADRQHQFQLGDGVSLSGDGLTLTFADPRPLEPIAAADFFPPKDAPNSYRHRVGHADQSLLYRPGRWFHDHNIEVSYRRKVQPQTAAKPEIALPKTLARLKARQPLTIGISGDSISTGLDASALTGAPPKQPGYPDLVAAQLEATYRSPVALANRAVAGWSVSHGVADRDKLLAERPHLVIVAYGMNDVGRRDPAWFASQTRDLVERIKKADPEIEFILVAPMLGNSEWIHTPREMFGKYRDELRKLTGAGVALADLTAVWTQLLAHKHDLDLTGNGLNHPNDFGHRLYAQALLELLAASR